MIKPIIQAVALEKQVIELDPSKASFEQVEHATKRLAHHFGALLTNIVRSRAVCPKPIRDICCDIKLIAKGHKKAGNWRAHVCSFLFSRLFLPALAVPEQCGLFNECTVHAFSPPVLRKKKTRRPTAFPRRQADIGPSHGHVEKLRPSIQGRSGIPLFSFLVSSQSLDAHASFHKKPTSEFSTRMSRRSGPSSTTFWSRCRCPCLCRRS